MLKNNPSSNKQTGFDTGKFEEDNNNYDFEVRMVLSYENLKTYGSPKHAERSDLTKKTEDGVIQMNKNERGELCEVCFRPVGHCFCSEAHASTETITAFQQKKHSCCVYNPVKKIYECGCSKRRPMTADNNMESIALIRRMINAPQPTSRDFLNTSNPRNKCGCKSGVQKFEYNHSATPSFTVNKPFVQTITGTCNKIETMKNRRRYCCNQKPIPSCLCSKEKPKCICKSEGHKIDDVKHEIKTDLGKTNSKDSYLKKPEVVRPRRRSAESVQSRKVKDDHCETGSISKRTINAARRRSSVENPIKKEDSKMKSKEAMRERSKDTISSKGSKDREIGKKDGSKTGEIASKRRSSIISHDKIEEKKVEDATVVAPQAVKSKSSRLSAEIQKKDKIEEKEVEDATVVAPQAAKSKSSRSSAEIQKKEGEETNVLKLERSMDPELMKYVEKSEPKLEPIEEVEVGEVIGTPKTVTDVQAGNVRRRKSSSASGVIETPVEEKRFEKTFAKPPPQSAPPKIKDEKSEEKPENDALPKGAESSDMEPEILTTTNEEDGKIIFDGSENPIEREKSASLKFTEENPPIEEENKGAEGEPMKISEEHLQETSSTPKLDEDIPHVDEEIKGDEGKIMEISEEHVQETSSTQKIEEDIPPVEEEDKGDEGKIMEIPEEQPTASKHEIEGVPPDESKIEEIPDRLEEPSEKKEEEVCVCKGCHASKDDQVQTRVNVFRISQGHTEICVEISYDNESTQVISDEIDKKDSEFQEIEILDEEKLPADKDTGESEPAASGRSGSKVSFKPPSSDSIKPMYSATSEPGVGYELLNIDSPEEMRQLMKENGLEDEQAKKDLEIGYELLNIDSPDEMIQLMKDNGLEEEPIVSAQAEKEDELVPTSLEKNQTCRQCSRIPIQKTKTTSKARRICHCSTNTEKKEISESGQQCQIIIGDNSEFIKESEPETDEKNINETPSRDVGAQKDSDEDVIFQMSEACSAHKAMDVEKHPPNPIAKKCVCDAHVNTDPRRMVNTGQATPCDLEIYARCKPSQTGGTAQQDVIASFVAISSLESCPTAQKFMIQTLLSQFAGDELGYDRLPSGRRLLSQNAMPSIQIQTGLDCASKCEAVQTVTTFIVTNEDDEIEAAEGVVNSVCSPDLPGLKTKISMNLGRLSTNKGEDDCVCAPACPVEDKPPAEQKTTVGTNMSYVIRRKNKNIFITVSAMQTDPCDPDICVLRDTHEEEITDNDKNDETTDNGTNTESIPTQEDGAGTENKQEQDNTPSEGFFTALTDPEPIDRVEGTKCVPETCEFFKSKTNSDSPLDNQTAEAQTGPCGSELCPYPERLSESKNVRIACSDSKSQVSKMQSCSDSSIPKQSSVYCNAVQTESTYQGPTSIDIIIKVPCNAQTCTDEPKAALKAETCDQETCTNERPNSAASCQTCPLVKEEVSKTVTTTVTYKYCDAGCNPLEEETVEEPKEGDIPCEPSCDPQKCDNAKENSITDAPTECDAFTCPDVPQKTAEDTECDAFTCPDVPQKTAEDTECDALTCPDVPQKTAEEKNVMAVPIKKDFCHDPYCSKIKLDEQDVFKLEIAVDKFIKK